MSWFEKHIISDWKESWRFHSSQAIAAVGFASTVIAGYPDLMIMLAQLLGGSSGVQALVITITFIILLLRIWRQDDEESNGSGGTDDHESEEV